MQLMSFFKLQGMTEEEAKNCIYTVDSQGLITADRKSLAAHKKCESYIGQTSGTLLINRFFSLRQD